MDPVLDFDGKSGVDEWDAEFDVFVAELAEYVVELNLVDSLRGREMDVITELAKPDVEVRDGEFDVDLGT